MVDVDDNRPEVAKKFGATKAINNIDGKAIERVMALQVIEKTGATRRSRTGDLLITNQLLYQLS